MSSECVGPSVVAQSKKIPVSGLRALASRGLKIPYEWVKKIVDGAHLWLLLRLSFKALASLALD